MTIDCKIPEIFKPLFLEPKRKNYLYGGRGSSKSHTVARYCVIRSLAKKEKILCTRELQKSIKESVHALLCRVIESMGLSALFEITLNTIVCKMTGSMFLFTGVKSNTNEIKSMEGVTICWVEEAQAMSQMSLDVLVPTIREVGSIIIFTFNPFLDTDPVYVEAMKGNSEDRLVIKANYQDNPFFPNVLRLEMEEDKRTDYDKYLWVWEGECKGLSAAQIFKGKFEVKEFTAPPDTYFYYGADWGFSQDPTAVTRSFVVGSELYIDYCAGGVGVDIEDIGEKIFDKIPLLRQNTVYCDNSRPETISAMCRKGYNCLGAEKWQGSVEDGVAYLKSFSKIYIHPRCKAVIEEFQLYQYKTDEQTGEILREIKDKYNHYIDSLRYAHIKPMRAKNSGRVYSSFTLPCIRTLSEQAISEIVNKTREIYFSTLVQNGRCFAIYSAYADSCLWVLNFKVFTKLDFQLIKEDFLMREKLEDSLVWLPFKSAKEVSANEIQAAREKGIMTRACAILPNNTEGSDIANALFAENRLFVLSDCSLLIQSLNAKTYRSEGMEDTKKQTLQDNLLSISNLFDYTLYRAKGITANFSETDKKKRQGKTLPSNQ